jgi:glycerol-3-phosphate dehydrogenase
VSGARFDIFIIGGGINGCGIARDAAGRGYSVGLAEMNDLAQGTSSASSKLIHGGLRYLEHYEFRLVREALAERERLWAIAPHIVWPMRFVLPHHKGLRPAWLLRAGLFLYDHLGGRDRLPPTKRIDLSHDGAGAPLKPEFTDAFEYSDCWVDDSRLVVLNAMDARARGATIATRTRCISARRSGGEWSIELRNEGTGRTTAVSARLLINAAGPWVDRVLQSVLGRNKAHNIRLVQGSHIIVRRLYEHDRCYTFQSTDGRVVFAIPYEQDFTLIGTTDRDLDSDPGEVAISDGEIDYLCAAVNAYFARLVTRADIVHTYAGVRPLLDDGASRAQEATRDYVLSVESPAGEPALINIFGGKITTYRRLAEAVMDKVEPLLGRRSAPWTSTKPLPGGDFPIDGFADLCAEIKSRHTYLDVAHATRLARAYGTLALKLLDGARSAPDLGHRFGATLTEREVEYLRRAEFASRSDDIVWRRSKLGLRMSPDEISALDRWMMATREAG